MFLLLRACERRQSLFRVEVKLFLERLLYDHDHCPPSMRKALSFRDGLPKHQACGAFLHYLKMFERMCPAADFAEASDSLTEQFKLGYLDPDLLHGLEQSVPPGDLKSISAFRQRRVVCVLTGTLPFPLRPFIAKIEIASQSLAEQKEQELAKNVRMADLNQLVARIEADMLLLKKIQQSADSAARETALDMKYMLERQMLLDRVWLLFAC